MDDSEFDRVPQIIFNGISSLEKIGCPGTLIPLTNDTRAVLCGADSNNVIIVATRFGLGRCLVFAHNSYPGIFLKNENKHQQFIENCRQWLARGYNADFMSIDDATTWQDIAANNKILVWNGHKAKSDAFMNDMVKGTFFFSKLNSFFSFCLVCIFTTWWCIDLWDNSMGLVTTK